MKEDLNDKIPPEERLPASLETHLRGLLGEKDLSRFSDQLPEAFLSDASEGLNKVNEKQLEAVLKQLNHHMHQQLGPKKTKRKRILIADMSWTYWAIIIILLLIVLGYFVISLKLKA